MVLDYLVESVQRGVVACEVERLPIRRDCARNLVSWASVAIKKCPLALGPELLGGLPQSTRRTAKRARPMGR